MPKFRPKLAFKELLQNVYMNWYEKILELNKLEEPSEEGSMNKVDEERIDNI
jgi:hypothetical protein